MRQVFTRDGLERDLAAGTVNFYCADCDERWGPTVEERIRLRALARRLRLSAELAR